MECSTALETVQACGCALPAMISGRREWRRTLDMASRLPVVGAGGLRVAHQVGAERIGAGLDHAEPGPEHRRIGPLGAASRAVRQVAVLRAGNLHRDDPADDDLVVVEKALQPL